MGKTKLKEFFSASFPAFWAVTTPSLLSEVQGEARSFLDAILPKAQQIDSLLVGTSLNPQPLIGWISIPLSDANRQGEIEGFISGVVIIARLMSPGDAFPPATILQSNSALIRKKAFIESHGDITKLELDYFRIQYQITLSPSLEIYVDARTPNIYLKEIFEELFDQIASTITLVT